MNLSSIHIPFDEELLPSMSLRFGIFNCMYEHGRIRYIKYGNIELIRMIYFAVRDKEWNTSPYVIENESIEIVDNGFTIGYSALHTLGDISYRSHVSIIAAGDTITFSAKGEALSNFQRNRIGICVLHPIKEFLGKHVIIEKPDGAKYESSFPNLISPFQPFEEVRKMHCVANTGISIDIIFDGDIFETEDQRNWADSSFKTYSTPLHIAFPVCVGKGDTIEQNVKLKFDTAGLLKNTSPSSEERESRFPKIGYCSGEGRLTQNDIKLLSELPFDHYRVELSLNDAHWEEILDARIIETIQLKTTLELILFFDENNEGELGKFVDAINQHSSIIASILILHPNHPVTAKEFIDISYARLKQVYPNIEIGYGTNVFFADLNRNRPNTDVLFDFVSFPITPQVHAIDTRSVLENVEQLQDLIQTARSFSNGKKIHISPITFKIRSLSAGDNGLPRDYDPRQHRNFGAWWTLCSIRNLCEADRLSFYTAKGEKGLLQDDTGDFAYTPLYNILRVLKKFKPLRILGDNKCRGIPDKITFENEAGDRLEFVLDNTGNILPVLSR